MPNMSFMNKPVTNNRFAMNPRTRVERAVFTNTWKHLTTFNAGELIPFYCDEVYPGDHFDVESVMVGRLATPVQPLMDDLYLDTFYFYVPYRLLWVHWNNFMGERSPNIDSSISYTVPQVQQVGGSTSRVLAQYFGIPIHVVGVPTITYNALPFRAYYLVYDEWFRDQDLQNKLAPPTDDGPDPATYAIQKRAKVPDYFTKARPWTQKGGVESAVAGVGTVRGIGIDPAAAWGVPPSPLHESGHADVTYAGGMLTTTANAVWIEQDPANALYPNITADFQIPINDLRMAEQVQELLERDARGGTRYTEITEAHFDVKNPDARLQRPEYLGGGSQRMGITAIPQTSETGSTPLGNLGAAAMVVERHRFSGAFTEHGVVLGLVNVRSVPSYQQGLHPMWSRETRYDFFWPEFGHLGEVPIFKRELFMQGTSTDLEVFGYRPYGEELRFHKSLITGRFRSGVPSSLDDWHLSQEFSSAPTLSSTFITENPPMERVLAAGSNADGQQVLLDVVMSGRFTRPVPAFGTPSLGGRF